MPRSENQKRKYLEDPERELAANRKYRKGQTYIDRNPAYQRKYNHGITDEQYTYLLDLQSGVCAICRNPETRKSKSGKVWSLGVDHDHSCCAGSRGRECGNCVRGLLCVSCNSVLGLLEEDSNRIKSMLRYLDKARVVFPTHILPESVV